VSSRTRVFVAVAVAVSGVVSVLAATAWTTSVPAVAVPSDDGIRTAMFDGSVFDGAGARRAFSAARATGSSVVRLTLEWKDIGPSGATAPDGFSPGNPGDPHYRWAAFDRKVRAAVAAGLSPLADIVDAPAWADDPPAATTGPGAPAPSALGAFARAAALRYSGHYHGLPRVRYWQVWNEPNLGVDLSPQLDHGQALAAVRYRAMVNAVADAVKDVHGDNLVVAGGLAPFRDLTTSTYARNKDWGPLSFMRAFFCLSSDLKPTCKVNVRFDIWSIHPYTSGGPQHHAALANDASLGDLPKVRRILDAAVNAGEVRTSQRISFWITEFSWDSNPPDPRGVPASLLARWVPDMLYEAWRNGVSLVAWFLVYDQPVNASVYQSGLYFASGKQKPYLEGYRFPVVAFKRGRSVYVWGRTPWSKPGLVHIEQRQGSNWRTLGTLRADDRGIFQRTFLRHGGGDVRVILAKTGEASLPFSLKPVPDRFYNPFGSTTPFEPQRPKSK
jgi:hypothetical protein